MPDETTDQVRSAVEAVWRIEAPHLVAGLTRLVRDLDVAEELAQDALVAALEQWPSEGVPRNPGAWLMTTAKRRAIDGIRRNERLAQKLRLLGHEQEIARQLESWEPESLGEGEIQDDLLRLVFTACHPALGAEARVALTLRLLGGLTTDEIARAYLVPEPTVAQRIVRAKRTIAAKRLPFEVPQGAELRERLASVLEVVYLIFNEGYSATAGEDWMRPALCEDALRLARVLQGLLPEEPEVHGLAALLELQASRLRARVDGAGAPVVLPDQDRSRWDRRLIQRGLSALALAQDRARSRGETLGVYGLQAAIAACHAAAPTPEATDWATISRLYAALAAVTGSPVVELNRAVAVSMSEGPEAGLALLDAVADTPALRDYHLLPSVRADLLARLGRNAEARKELERAAALTRNEAERALLRERADAQGREARSDLRLRRLGASNHPWGSPRRRQGEDGPAR